MLSSLRAEYDTEVDMKEDQWLESLLSCSQRDEFELESLGEVFVLTVTKGQNFKAETRWINKRDELKDHAEPEQ